MKKQALVVGLGQFGMSVARALAASGMDVLAVDNKAARVQMIVPHVAQAVTFDASDESALSRAEPALKDICVCAIGPESRENAILVTALLKQMGARMVIGRASDALTERIMTVVGADEVVNPERDFGERLAKRLAHEGLLDQVPLGSNLMISELTPPMSMQGRSLADLALPKRFEVSVVGIRKNTGFGSQLEMPGPSSVISEGDILVVVSSPKSITRMLETMK
jgi:trk system potassium uptake protein TrkA